MFSSIKAFQLYMSRQVLYMVWILGSGGMEDIDDLFLNKIKGKKYSFAFLCFPQCKTAVVPTSAEQWVVALNNQHIIECILRHEHSISRVVYWSWTKIPEGIEKMFFKKMQWSKLCYCLKTTTDSICIFLYILNSGVLWLLLTSFTRITNLQRISCIYVIYSLPNI